MKPPKFSISPDNDQVAVYTDKFKAVCDKERFIAEINGEELSCPIEKLGSQTDDPHVNLNKGLAWIIHLRLCK